MRIVEHNMAEELAVKLLGWKWLSFVGQPTKDHPRYPDKIRVRQLFPPRQLDDAQWNAFLYKNEAQPANGSEPLSYAYDSSNGPARLPKFTILVDE